MKRETFAERVRRLREWRHMGSYAASEMMGRTGSYLSMLETGKRWADKMPPYDDLQSLAKVLRVTVPQLVGDELIPGFDGPTGVIREGQAWYEVASDDDLMERAGLRVVPPNSIPLVDGVALHAGAGRAVIPQDIDDATPRAVRGRRRPHLRYLVVTGTCMEPDVRDGDLVIVDRDGAIRPGLLVAAVVRGEEPIIRWYRPRNGDDWLVSNEENDPGIIVDRHVRITGLVLSVTHSFLR